MRRHQREAARPGLIMGLEATGAAAPLSDAFGRRFAYLRLSVTDACNFRCTYCLPQGYQRVPGEAAPLGLEEIGRLVGALASLGIHKVRLTGGEPTLRRDLEDIVRVVAATPGVRTVALSTNGYRLGRLAERLVAAGLTHVNVSIDSLDPTTFERITGHTELDEVLAGVDAAIAAGLRVKLNAVVLRGLNDAMLTSFLPWIEQRPIVIRFIQLMETGANAQFFAEHHMALDGLRGALRASGWQRRPRGEADGPAEEYVHPAFVGGVGIIAPYGEHFCATCNRLRVTSRGALRLCLFGEAGHDLRPLLQDDAQRVELVETVRGLLGYKPSGHRLAEGDFGAAVSLAQVGG